MINKQQNKENNQFFLFSSSSSSSEMVMVYVSISHYAKVEQHIAKHSIMNHFVRKRIFPFRSSKWLLLTFRPRNLFVFLSDWRSDFCHILPWSCNIHSRVLSHRNQIIITVSHRRRRERRKKRGINCRMMCHVHITILLTTILYRQQEKERREKKNAIANSVDVRNDVAMCRSKNAPSFDVVLEEKSSFTQLEICP